MKQFNNQPDATRYSQLLQNFNQEGNPWSPSQKSRAVRSLLLAKDQHLVVRECQPNKLYVVMDSITAYAGPNSRGTYFQHGSLVGFGDIKDTEHGTMVDVTVCGNIFQVTSNPGTMNQSSTWVDHVETQNGVAYIERIKVMELEEANELLAQFK